jgi:PadR family transcriptional regulator AphA
MSMPSEDMPSRHMPIGTTREPETDATMNIRTLCLAILHESDATGYEIKKLSVEGKYRYFAEASFGSIYPTLARLEQEGLVTLREETQPGKPSRKIYSITEAGRRALVEALSEPPSPDVFRSGFLLVALCAELLDRRTIVTAVEGRIAHLRDEIGHLEELLRSTNDPATHWAASYGVACMTRSQEYLAEHRHEIEALARDDGTSPAGAPEAIRRPAMSREPVA